jgi:CRP-like cAMP-binding protein
MARSDPEAMDAARALRAVAPRLGFGEAARARLARAARVRRYAAGQTVFRQGDPSETLVVVLAGRIVVSALSPEGAEVILNLMEPGEVVGEIGALDGGPRSADARAARDSRVLLIPRAALLRELEAEPRATRTLVRLLCARLRQTTAFVEDATLAPLAARLLHRVQALARSYAGVDGAATAPGPWRIEHGLSQQEIGESIGASRVSVNQQLNAWRAQGLVEFGRGFIVVRDPEGLEACVRGEGERSARVM